MGIGTGGGGAGGTDVDSGSTGAGGSGSQHRLSIRFDYRFDTIGFFDVPGRRAALEAAGALWSRSIADDFDPVPKGTRIRLRNPENRDEYVWVEGIEEDIDDLVVFVGISDVIPGYGRGGPSGTAEPVDPALISVLINRRDGADFEPWAGSISFKAAPDWYFDATPETADDIPRQSYDFISVAAHELGHVLGFSDCEAFNAFVSGATFTGPKAVASHGGPVPLEPGAAHLLNGLLSNGARTLMDPSQSIGGRNGPTELDLAVLDDAGYDIATP